MKPTVTVTPFGKVFFLMLATYGAGWLLLQYVAPPFGVMVLGALCGLALFRMMWLAQQVHQSFRDRHEILAQIVEHFLEPAEAYDRYVQARSTAPLGDGAAQLVKAIVLTLRDVGDPEIPPDEFNRRARHRVQQIPRDLSE